MALRRPARTTRPRPNPSTAPARGRRARPAGRSASRTATNAPVIAAHRVPPSASSTSQSMYSVRGPIASMSTTARSERPIRRWISTVRPSGRPARDVARPAAARGGGQHPVLRRQPPAAGRLAPRGRARRPATPCRSRACRPSTISADPSALRTKPGSICTGRSASCARPSWRVRVSGRSRLTAGDATAVRSRARRLVSVLDLADGLPDLLQDHRAELLALGELRALQRGDHSRPSRSRRASPARRTRPFPDHARRRHAAAPRASGREHLT